MKRSIIASLFLLPSLLFCSVSHAQQCALKESEAVLNGPEHEVLRCPGGDIIAITYPFQEDKDPVTVARFDPRLTQLYTNPLQELSTQHYQTAMYGGSRLFLFCSQKDGAISRYEVDDKTGKLIGSPVALFSLDGKEEDAKFHSGSSPDKHFHYLLTESHQKKEKGKLLQGAIFDQQMTKVAAFSYTTPDDRDDIQHLDFVQTNSGALSIIYNVGVKAKKDNYTPYLYTIIQVDARGKTTATPVTGLPEGDLRNISWSPFGEKLQFTGLLSHLRKSGFTSILSGTFDPGQRKVADIHQTEVSTLLARMPDFMKDMATKGIPADETLLKTIPLSDGSRALILEANSDRFYQSYYAPAMQNPSPAFNKPGMSTGPGAFTTSYSMTYHNRGDVYILKLDKTNTPQWLNLISKRQTEGDVVIAIGIACTVDDKDNIHVFFYDNKKNTDPNKKSPIDVSGTDYKKNQLACVSVAPDGTMKKQFLEKEDPEFRLMPEKSLADKNSEICFVAIKTKKAFTVTHLFNHAHFHLDMMAVR